MLVQSSWGQFCPGEIVNFETEKIMWVKFVNKQSNEMLFVAACYIPPPVDSSHDVARCQRMLPGTKKNKNSSIKWKVE